VGEVVSLLVLLYAFGSRWSVIPPLGVCGWRAWCCWFRSPARWAGGAVRRADAVPAGRLRSSAAFSLVGSAFGSGGIRSRSLSVNVAAPVATRRDRWLRADGNRVSILPVYEGGSTVGDPIRITCRQATWCSPMARPRRVERRDRVEPPVFFTCSSDCREDVARGYVYELVTSRCWSQKSSASAASRRTTRSRAATGRGGGAKSGLLGACVRQHHHAVGTYSGRRWRSPVTRSGGAPHSLNHVLREPPSRADLSAAPAHAEAPSESAEVRPSAPRTTT
jgi:hypothetical protein